MPDDTDIMMILHVLLKNKCSEEDHKMLLRPLTTAVESVPSNELTQSVAAIPLHLVYVHC